VPFAPIEAKLAAAGAGEDRFGGEDRGATARLAATERRLDEVERRGRARVDEAEARAVELRRKLEDASAEANSAMRVARAQGEEIEELRGRLRRSLASSPSSDPRAG